MMEADGKKVLLFICCWDEEEGEGAVNETRTLLSLELVDKVQNSDDDHSLAAQVSRPLLLPAAAHRL